MDPRRLLPGLIVMTALCVATTLALVVLRSGGEGRAAAHSTAVAPGVATSSAAEILAEWDRGRSQAWARVDAGALTDLYMPGSRTGAADVASLRRWAARRLRVRGMLTQVLELRVIERTTHRLVLLSTDRLVGAQAVGETAQFALPADRASTRRIVMRRVAGQWLVEDVRDQARAAASTS